MKLTVEGDPEEIKSFFKQLQPAEKTGKVDTCGIHWNDDEMKTIEPAKDWYEAVALYRAAFPDSPRNRDGIRKKWWEMNRKKPAVAPEVKDPQPGQTGCEGCPDHEFNDQGCDMCSPPPAPIAPVLKERYNPPKSEKKSASKTPPAQKEVVAVSEKSPNSKKKSRKESNAKNALVPAWTEEQKTLVKGCKTKEEAWGKFKEKYPGQRNENAVSQRFNLLKKKADTSKDSGQAITQSNDAKEPKKPRVKKERLPYKLKNQGPESPLHEEPAIQYPDEQPHTAAEEGPLDPPELPEPENPQIQGIDQDLMEALPEERPPTGTQEKREAAKTMENIKIGDQVRQIGGLKICAGIGIIKRAPAGNPEVLVGFGNGQEWINRKNLAPVMA